MAMTINQITIENFGGIAHLAVLSQIIDAFDIGDYVVEYDDHYHCKNCVGDLFN